MRASVLRPAPDWHGVPSPRQQPRSVAAQRLDGVAGGRAALARPALAARGASAHAPPRVATRTARVAASPTPAPPTSTSSHAPPRVPTRTARVAASPTPAPPTSTSSPSSPSARAEATLRSFYDAYNRGDAAAAAACMAEDCSYHDTVFPEPFIGRAAVRGHFERTFAALGPAVKFCIDAVAASPDGRSAGVKWHCELDDGTPLPNSRGVSFIEFDEGGLVAGARDCVEPAIKPGGAALALLRAVLPAVRAAGKAEKSRPPFLASLTPLSAALWAGYGVYFASIFFSSSLPGVPVWQTPPEVLRAVWNESLNFFYVNPALHALGLTAIPDNPEHPASEAIFNFDAAWGLLFGPAWAADWKRRVRAGVPDGEAAKLWVGVMLLTNVFAWPYMAVREREVQGGGGRGAQHPPSSALPSGLDPAALPGWAAPVGAVGGAVGAISLAWAAFARPDIGGSLADRAAWLAAAVGHDDRALFAFVLDACCYAVWQAVLLKGAAPGYRFVPFFGLAAWLVAEGGRKEGV